MPNQCRHIPPLMVKMTRLLGRQENSVGISPHLFVRIVGCICRLVRKFCTEEYIFVSVRRFFVDGNVGSRLYRRPTIIYSRSRQLKYVSTVVDCKSTILLALSIIHWNIAPHCLHSCGAAATRRQQALRYISSGCIGCTSTWMGLLFVHVEYSVSCSLHHGQRGAQTRRREYMALDASPLHLLHRDQDVATAS